MDMGDFARAEHFRREIELLWDRRAKDKRQAQRASQPSFKLHSLYERTLSDPLEQQTMVTPSKPDDRDLELATRWLNRKSNESEWRRMLSARLAELAAISFFSELGDETSDVSITQLDGPGDWLTHDLVTNGRPIDVKNARAFSSNPSRYVMSHPGFDGGFDARVSLAEGEARSHGESEEVSGGVVGACHAVGVRVGASDHARMVSSLTWRQHPTRTAIYHSSPILIL